MTNTNWRTELENILNTEVSNTWTKLTLAKAFNDATEKAVMEALKDQKAELLEAVEKEKKEYEAPGSVEENCREIIKFGFNDCLEIIKGLIKRV